MAIDAASAVLLAALDGQRPSPEELSFFQNEQPAGVTLFRRNVPQSFSDLRSMCLHLQDILGKKSRAIIAIDQEGGRVSRLPSPFPNLGAPLHLGSENPDDRLIENYGFIVGSSLLQLGINTNFAPVCDIYTNPENIAIGDRSFASSPEAVTLRAGDFLLGMQAAGVLGCLKHFPGQGDANEDTHHSGTQIDLSKELLSQRELKPFMELHHKAPMIMVSHAVFSSYDDSPASLSSRVMEDLLRKEMKYKGVIVTDDMNMKALPQDDDAWVDSLCESIIAGANLVLVCKGLERCQLALRGLRKRAAESAAFKKTLEAAADRVQHLRSQLS